MRRPRVEHLEDRSACSATALRLADAVALTLRPDPSAVVSVVPVEVTPDATPTRGPAFADGHAAPAPAVVADGPTAVVDWGDGVVMPATVTVHPDGQVEVVVERALAVPATYEVEVTVFGAAGGPTVFAFVVTTTAATPDAAPAPAPTPTEPPSETPAPPQFTPQPPADPAPQTPMPSPLPAQPVVVRVTVTPPVFLPSSRPQFEAGVVRVALAAPPAPTVAVTATAPAQVSSVVVVWAWPPAAGPQPPAVETPTPTVAPPRSLEVAAAVRTTLVPVAVRPAAPQPEADWHGAAADADPAEAVLAALADAELPDAPFFPAVAAPEEQPDEPSRRRVAYFILAALAGVGTRHVLRHDPTPDARRF